MTTREPSVFVDFNADEGNVIRALRKRASMPDDLDFGQALRLEDHEGNSCLGYVVDLTERHVMVRPDYSTWIDANPVHITQQKQQLDEALRQRLRFTASADTTTTPELAGVS